MNKLLTDTHTHTYRGVAQYQKNVSPVDRDNCVIIKVKHICCVK